MDSAVDVVIEDARWQVLDLGGLADRAVAHTLTHQDLATSWAVVVMGCDDAQIADLNTEFRGKPTTTNVLSWPAQDLAQPPAAPRPPTADPFGDYSLGDIALAYETCQREAAAAEIPLTQHVTHLIVHATLHLLGYDHISDTDAARMEAAEIEILAQLGQPDPYNIG
ncbi:rRNA maturation RNase YbeY [Algirhabdus cladophorae]|uniref:rRNA maturation RNase YbeY n=1 Tax=Algirhabdus cladophorae TaxID=3377108 RepID=UPI003B8450F0